MLIKGVKITPPKDRVVVFPREDQEDIVLTIRAVLDYSRFEELCPVPRPPTTRRPNQAPVSNTEAPKFLAALDAHSLKRSHWMIIQSLSATDGIEWEIVDHNDPETWHLYDQELRTSGFSLGEIGRIFEEVNAVSGIDQERVDEATRAFLATREEQRSSGSSQTEEQTSTPSGGPAS